MFSDTHFHYKNITRDSGLNGVEILKSLVERNTFFAQDIGTHCDDLDERVSVLKEDIALLPDELQKSALNMLHLSAGIWPDTSAIKDRINQVAILEKNIAQALSSQDSLKKKIVSLGECGLDHHWNPSGADGRTESDFNTDMFYGEQELFEMQLNLAKKFNLPVIIHSRDAFQDTYDCINRVGYHNGIIHCYSYGLAEAKAFLDKGWYISFSGSVTYTKKSKLEDMKSLIRYVPQDRILIETDAPYLAPVPFRGKVNTPEYIPHTYTFCSDIIGILPETLSEIVDKNIKILFNLQ